MNGRGCELNPANYRCTFWTWAIAVARSVARIDHFGGKLALTDMPQYDAVLDALGDRTRRTVLDRLRAGPLPVVEIARDLPVSRPAVSQHLRVLKDAGLVVDRQEGTRRIYAIDPSGLALLRAYVEAFWQSALLRYAQAADAGVPES
jgi:DNA-binding transcriptional ArsR family regulator